MADFDDAKASSERDDDVDRLEPDEVQNDDFQFALAELLAGYEPVLKDELARAGKPDELTAEALERPPSCEEEFELAQRIFGRFFTEEVALRVLPAEARERIGPIDRWRWCLGHIRCCFIFGWLVCRRARTFKAFGYYLYRYWLCVRDALNPEDPPSRRPLHDEERADLAKLMEALAGAYRPYLGDQLASLDFAAGLPDEIIAGAIDCDEGEQDTAAVFERLLTMDIAPALLGRKAFEEHSQDASFWFCRCWCLCAIRFGCCLARARRFTDVLRCLAYYRRCLRRCFQPLTCDIARPAMTECVDENFFSGPNLLGVEIAGTAVGAFCDHYTLEWKPAGWADSTYTQVGIVYPGGAPTGPCGVINGTLGWLDTTSQDVPDSVTVRLCVFASTGASTCCLVDFQIFRQRVWIANVEGVPPSPSILVPTAQLMSGSRVRSFGTCVRIFGRAWVGRCPGKEISRYTLAYQPGFVTDPTLGTWTPAWQVDYITPLQRKEIRTEEFDLTSCWAYTPVVLPSPPFPPGLTIPRDSLLPTCWVSGKYSPSGPPSGAQSCAVDPQNPGTIWTSQQLPFLNCQSGRYTLRLDVEDTAGNHYYDTQQIWFDNKDIHGKITQIGNVPACDTVHLSNFAADGGDCTTPWLAEARGIAFDELIEEGNTAIPSDNYAAVGGVIQGGYRLWIKKDGAPDPGVPLPVPGPGGPFLGTTRVGDPGTRCTTANPPAGPIPPETSGVLTLIDLSQLDDVCNPGHPDLTLKRGECCGYVITLEVFDNSVVPSGPGGHHGISHHFPVCICNDVKG
ncbi:hypothetical protein OM076_35925 [Solirubrobacter ginsenosidimutans]|uniref:Uncharacterized protein n=1 Tax=Solirubrobacter ginsenosidimutans TaxID=490573 RepID=A0A9X3N2W9_9ACTN|nr:hypothetical protein [Solirubrobacter ginsenosidimutans]MDA0165712.1 hypothetical protein [Solirubrobacter ginsenosidimutans]